MFEIYSRLAERALEGERGTPPSPEEALWVLEGEDVALLPLLQAAFVPRAHHFGRAVGVQILDNLQNGLCPEDCGYCAQSRVSKAAVRPYPMKSDEEIFAGAERAVRAGAVRYCMALSGRGPSLERTRRVAKLIRALKARHRIEFCLSAGIMGDEHARILAEAGLDRLNHNLNTSESHYPSICSSHRWRDRLETLEAARRQGLEICSGLIVGMGESNRDLVEVAFELRDLEAASIPVNFLIPIEGNPLREDGTLCPERCLRVLCLMRLVNPSAEIRVAGGREGNLRGMQGLALYPANSLFVDGYLTTRGESLQDTFKMIEDAGFQVAEVEGAEALGTENIEPSMSSNALRADSRFVIPGGGDELLRPEIVRQSEP